MIEDKGSYIARIVKKENLDRVNKSSQSVYPKNSLYLRYFKRVIDLIITVPIFLMLLPVNFIIGIITFFDVGFPIFFKQERTGKNGKHFFLVKFRNMTNARINTEIFCHRMIELQNLEHLLENILWTNF